jgi:hypothetical protein
MATSQAFLPSEQIAFWQVELNKEKYFIPTTPYIVAKMSLSVLYCVLDLPIALRRVSNFETNAGIIPTYSLSLRK